MAETLVVYHSRSGTTEAVARRLADVLEADLEAVRPAAGSYAGASGFLRGLFQASRALTPAIVPCRDPSAYRLVVVGSPVWAGFVSAPIRTYLVAHRARLHAVAAFCTSGSGVAAPVFEQIRDLIGGRSLQDVLSLSRQAVETGAADAEIVRWAKQLSEQIREPGRTAA